MRKTLTALLLAATLPTMAMAMPEGGPRHERGFGGHMFKELNLTEEQRHDIGKLMRDQMKTRHDITERYLDKLPAAEKKAMQDELKAAETKNRDAIRAKLKPEQQKTFDDIQKKMEERRAERAEFEAWKAEKDKKAQ
ncbi:Spy/CpxP family protein refolding chaperone [Pseudomonas sp. BN515]|uniref:Spy/CpxP family protein refolding chaperone n=1 Tax=Pseudomonas sp. BN515 TaxID=2567892 RepID=UPI0024558396|nr:Spy/CpxP family protein refolding chaperone [Pseudomonas sp. BN515]MDH4871173.1 LTXXQ domain protein [Pseudomonas sp. BN515]